MCTPIVYVDVDVRIGPLFKTTLSRLLAANHGLVQILAIIATHHLSGLGGTMSSNETYRHTSTHSKIRLTNRFKWKASKI